jgi:hypothetical protein
MTTAVGQTAEWLYTEMFQRSEDRDDWRDLGGWWAKVETPVGPRPHTIAWRNSETSVRERVRDEWTTSFTASYVFALMLAQVEAGQREPFQFCGQCERTYPARQARTVHDCDGGQIFQVCSICNDLEYRTLRLQDNIRVSRHDCVYLHDVEEYVTEMWAERNCFHSRATDAWYLSDDAAAEADREYYRDESDMPTFDYHSVTPMSVHGWPDATPGDSLCFGVELEMEAADSDYTSQEDLGKALGGRTGMGSRVSNDGIAGTYILMNDGSLNATGVELITNPYTLEFHQSKFGWQSLLANVTGIARSGSHTSACGMHVHCNRKAISALTLGKALVFVNSRENSALIERIAQRTGEQWAARSPKKIVDGKAQRTSKYEAMHIADKTIEFRIFRGNLRWDRVLKNIEFCHSVFNYAAVAAMEAVLTKKDYLQWLNKNRGMYPNLVRFLGETYGFRDTAKNKARTTEI